MTTYGARILDTSVGRLVFSAPSLSSPERVGQVAAGAIATLVCRDGRRREDLVLEPFVSEGSGYRRMTGAEKSQMRAAVAEFAQDARRA